MYVLGASIYHLSLWFNYSARNAVCVVYMCSALPTELPRQPSWLGYILGKAMLQLLSETVYTLLQLIIK